MATSPNRTPDSGEDSITDPASEPISTIIRQPTQEPLPVWPDALGAVRGQALEPLHPAAVKASQETPTLASLLSIIDSLRAGDVRVRKVAATALHKTLKQASSHQTASGTHEQPRSA